MSKTKQTAAIRWLRHLALSALAVAALGACSPYASVDIGVPFDIGPVRVNPSIGIGGFL